MQGLGPSHVLPHSPEHEVIHCCIFAMFLMKLDFSKHFLALVSPDLVLQAALQPQAIGYVHTSVKLSK